MLPVDFPLKEASSSNNKKFYILCLAMLSNGKTYNVLYERQQLLPCSGVTFVQRWNNRPELGFSKAGSSSHPYRQSVA